MLRILRLLLSFALIAILLGNLSASAQIALKPNGRNAIPLRVKSLQAEVAVERQFAVTKLTLTFLNETSASIEADFLYTLPPDTRVTSFAYWYGKEKVVARIVEKEEAAAIYAHITSRLRDPALVEMVGKNTFRARIFPVMPNADLKVEMTLVQTLLSDAQGAHFTLPLQAKRGQPLESVKVSAQIKPDDDLAGVTSNYSLPITRTSDKGYLLKLSGKNYRPQKDLRINLLRSPQPLHAALFSARSGGKDGFFALALTPNVALTRPRVRITGVTTYQVLPASQSSVKAHRLLTLFGRYRGRGLAQVTLTGMVKGKPWVVTRSIRFSSQRQGNNLATKLWAARRMERMSAGKGHRAAVIALSKRYGMPSKYTSWLAVPKEEMKQYNWERNLAKAEVTARRLAREILQGRGQGKQAKILEAKLKALCRELGNDYSPASFLRAPFEAKAEVTARRLAREILQGRGQGKQAKMLQSQLKMLCRELGYDYRPATFLRGHLSVGVFQAGQKLSDLILKRQEGSAQARRARMALKQTAELSGLERDDLRYLALYDVDRKMDSLAVEIVNSEHGGVISRTYLGYDTDNYPGGNRIPLYTFNTDFPNSLKGWRWKVEPRARDPKRAAALRHELDRLARATGFSASDYLKPQERIWQQYELKQAYAQLEEERKKPQPDSRRIRLLEADFKARDARFIRAGWPQTRQERLERRRDLDNVEEALARPSSLDAPTLAALRRRQTELPRVRWGDPLLSVEAPKDAQQVIALMPGGEIKRLTYQAQSGRWEARFDIPTYASEGEYAITVIIVLKDGSRKTLVIRYHVDLTPPVGTGQAQVTRNAQPTLRLELDGGPDTARVKALLPWGQVVEMKAAAPSRRFFAFVPLTPERRALGSVITYILTDRAHNRTTICVDMTEN